MPVGSDNISMQGIAVSGSFEVQTNISLQTIWTTFVTANPSGGNLRLNDMANKDYPTVTTSAASSVTGTSMTCNGNVTADGGIIGGITQRGDSRQTVGIKMGNQNMIEVIKTRVGIKIRRLENKTKKLEPTNDDTCNHYVFSNVKCKDIPIPA